MSQGVFTPELRFEWVKGEVTSGTPSAGFVACGDGTAFPMEVTLDQLAEIMYRARFAEFTNSSFKLDLSDVGAGVASGASSPRVQYNTGSGFGGNYRMSGYWCLDSTGIETEPSVFEDFIPSDFALNYLGSPYSVDVYADSSVEWFGYPEQLTFRDMSDNERALWVPHVDGKFSNWNNQGEPESLGYSFGWFGTSYTSKLAGYDFDQFKTAFTWYSRSHAGALDDPPALNIPWISDLFYPPDVIYEQLEVCVQFNGRVGVVGDFENIHDPDNRFFIGMHVSGTISDAFPFSTSTELISGSTISSELPTSATYKMVLSASSITIPIYRSDVYEYELAGEFEHSITEWWPYAKNSPAVPVCDTTDGTKIP